MKNLRPYRFPPLAQVLAANAESPLSSAILKDFQDGYDHGYRDGQEKGLVVGQEEGRATGFRVGQEEGHQQAMQDFEMLAKPIDAMIDGLKQLQADYRSALRKEVVDLVAKVARQVIRCELALQPVQLLALVDETLSAMPPTAEGIEVYLNPEELQRIQELAPERADRWTLIADSRMELGECRVKAGGNEADAGCKQRLAACVEQIDKQLQEQAESEELG
jgi:flagellar assembly protein FliH